MSPADVPVVILCGGLGTRLREETEARPKPMVEVGHAPILWHIMKLYAHHGFRQFVLCLGYRSDVIKEFFRNFEYWQRDLTWSFGSGNSPELGGPPPADWQVTLAETGHDTMTGGRIQRIQRYITSDVFMATYGDGLADIDLAAELRFHLQHGKAATLAAVTPVSRFGVLDVAADGSISHFREKPILEERVNGGFYVFDRRVFGYLTPDCVLEEAPMQQLADDKLLMAYPHPGTFYCMDTYRDYLSLNKLWNEGQARWKLWND